MGTRDVAATKMSATWMNNSNKGKESKKRKDKKDERCKLLLDVQRERIVFDQERVQGRMIIETEDEDGEDEEIGGNEA